MNEQDIYHIGHPFREGITYCAIAMPPEQSLLNPRDQVRICPECARRFKRQRPKEPEPGTGNDPG